MIEVQLVLENEFGEFSGRKTIITEEQHMFIIEKSKKFYDGGFELTLEDNTFMVFPPDIVKKSILKIKCKNV